MSVITGILGYTLPTDEIGSLATVTVQAGGPAATGYGVTYLTDFTDANLGRPCLSTTTQMSLQADFGSAKSVQSIIIWHNLDAGSTLTIQANATASWGSPSYSATITILAKRGDGRFVKVYIKPNQNFRYWLIKSPTNSVNPGFKAQFYLAYRTFTGISNGAVGGGQQFSWGTRRPNAQFGIDLTTDYDFHWVYPFDVGAESITGPIILSMADLDALRFAHQATGGRRLQLFVPDSGSAEAWLTRMTLGPAPYANSQGLYTSILDPQLAGPLHNVVQLSVQDMTAGGPEWL